MKKMGTLKTFAIVDGESSEREEGAKSVRYQTSRFGCSIPILRKGRLHVVPGTGGSLIKARLESGTHLVSHAFPPT